MDTNFDSDGTVLQMNNDGFELDRTATGATYVEMSTLTNEKTPARTGACVAVNGVCTSVAAANGNAAGKGARAAPESPWHRIKSISLGVIIILLIVWVFAYVVIDRNRLMW
jgi:hypothetical protein